MDVANCDAAAGQAVDVDFVQVLALIPCVDGDGDGYGNPTAGCASTLVDCNDASATVHPGAAETCADFVDNDCDGAADCVDTQCDGAACSDLFLCTQVDFCTGGVCVGSGDPCGDNFDADCSRCNEVSLTCTAPEPIGSSCGDTTSNECTGADSCNSTGACMQNHVADGTPCGALVGECMTQGACVSGVCSSATPRAAGTACGSAVNDACTSPDTCDGAGTCLPNHAANATPCDDADPCTTGDVCDAAGRCSGVGECGPPDVPPPSTEPAPPQAEPVPSPVDPAVSGGCSCRSSNDASVAAVLLGLMLWRLGSSRARSATRRCR